MSTTTALLHSVMRRSIRGTLTARLVQCRVCTRQAARRQAVTVRKCAEETSSLRRVGVAACATWALDSSLSFFHTLSVSRHCREHNPDVPFIKWVHARITLGSSRTQSEPWYRRSDGHAPGPSQSRPLQGASTSRMCLMRCGSDSMSWAGLISLLAMKEDERDDLRAVSFLGSALAQKSSR